MSKISTAYQFLMDVKDYYQFSDEKDAIMKSLLCVFTCTISSPIDFANKFWRFMQIVHNLDILSSNYDELVSSDAGDADFELSIGGRAVFPTTLHPAHPRYARQFVYPGWALNQSSQFNELRRQGIFEGWQKTIRKADASSDPSGEQNPFLLNHGQGSAASQLGQWDFEFYPFVSNVNTDRRKLKDQLLSILYKEANNSDVIDYLESLAL